MATTSSRTQALLAWAAEKDIWIHPSLHVHDDDAGIHIIAAAPIPPDSTVVRIPKAAILSPRSSPAAAYIPRPSDPTASHAPLALAFALHVELMDGPRSKWSGYLQSFPPPGCVHPALFWTEVRDDEREARAWIAGTEIERELCGDSGCSILDEARRYHADVVLPALSTHRPELAPRSSEADWLYACSLVTSRAFLVDAYHGLAMVPIADAFNHTNENHVQLESDYDVCPECGALDECPHDTPPSSPAPAGPSATQPAFSTHEHLEMVSSRAIVSGEEVYNTYGSALSNAALLARYGFVLEGNERDTVSWTRAELGLGARQAEEVARAESTLVFWPEDGACCVNGDAQVSGALLGWVAGGAEACTAVLRELEALQRESDDDAHEGRAVYRELAAAAGALCALFEARIARMGAQRLSVGELGEMLDRLPNDRPKTRLALSHLLAERCVLESALEAWREVREACSE